MAAVADAVPPVNADPDEVQVLGVPYLDEEEVTRWVNLTNGWQLLPQNITLWTSVVNYRMTMCYDIKIKENEQTILKATIMRPSISKEDQKNFQTYLFLHCVLLPAMKRLIGPQIPCPFDSKVLGYRISDLAFRHRVNGLRDLGGDVVIFAAETDAERSSVLLLQTSSDENFKACDDFFSEQHVQSCIKTMAQLDAMSHILLHPARVPRMEFEELSAMYQRPGDRHANAKLRFLKASANALHRSIPEFDDWDNEDSRTFSELIGTYHSNLKTSAAADPTDICMCILNVYPNNFLFKPIGQQAENAQYASILTWRDSYHQDLKLNLGMHAFNLNTLLCGVKKPSHNDIYHIAYSAELRTFHNRIVVANYDGSLGNLPEHPLSLSLDDLTASNFVNTLRVAWFTSKLHKCFTNAIVKAGDAAENQLMSLNDWAREQRPDYHKALNFSQEKFADEVDSILGRGDGWSLDFIADIKDMMGEWWEANEMWG